MLPRPRMLVLFHITISIAQGYLSLFLLQCLCNKYHLHCVHLNKRMVWYEYLVNRSIYGRMVAYSMLKYIANILIIDYNLIYAWKRNYYKLYEARFWYDLTSIHLVMWHRQWREEQLFKKQQNARIRYTDTHTGIQLQRLWISIKSFYDLRVLMSDDDFCKCFKILLRVVLLIFELDYAIIFVEMIDLKNSEQCRACDI